MAAYFVTDSGKEYQRHIDNSLDGIVIEDITMVQVDGHELEHVQNKFSGLPVSNGRVVKYYGDHAKFIAGNW